MATAFLISATLALVAIVLICMSLLKKINDYENQIKQCRREIEEILKTEEKPICERCQWQVLCAGEGEKPKKRECVNFKEVGI